jgi:hypothetical protein
VIRHSISDVRAFRKIRTNSRLQVLIVFDEKEKTHLGPVKTSSNLGAPKRKTHVSRVGSSNGVHGKTTSLVGSSKESRLGVNINRGGHLEWSSLTLIVSVDGKDRRYISS